MIQRVQTVFLLLIVVISITLANLNIPYFTEQNSDQSQMVLVDFNSTDAVYTDALEGSVTWEGHNAGLIYFMYAVGLLALITIFLYKNRKLQSRLIMAIMIFAIIVMVDMYWYSYQMDYFEGSGVQTLKPIAATPVSMILFAILALRGVQKDEKLVRSVDRIR